jgi:lipopolysaccharide export LptBFGC system permease protein LptF
MGILTRYVFRGAFVNCLYLLTIAVSIVWIVQAIQYLKILINHTISIFSVLYLTLLLVPGILVYVLPFTFCIGAVLFYKQFNDTNELEILPMLGVGSTYKSLLLCASLMTAFQVFAQLITPIATKEFFIKEAEIRKQISLKILKPRQFNLRDGAAVFFERREGLKIYDVFLSYKNSYITAHSAVLDYDPIKGYNLIIQNGVTVNDAPDQKTRVSFDHMECGIGHILPQPRKSHLLMSKTISELYKDYSYESRYEIISRYIRMSLPLLNSGVVYLFLFVLPVSSPFMWAALGASAFNAVMIVVGKVFVRFI